VELGAGRESERGAAEPLWRPSGICCALAKYALHFTGQAFHGRTVAGGVKC
jgi:hypothetical protein